MTHRFNITPRAKADLNNIWNYTVETWSTEQADRYITDIYKKFSWLANRPNVGKHRPDILDSYYCFPHAQHLIFYLIRKKSIDIIGVPHRSMDIDRFFED